MVWRKRSLARAGKINHIDISAASSGDNEIIAAVASLKHKILGMHLVAAGAVNCRFESGGGGTALTGVMTLAQGVPYTLPIQGPGYHWIETLAGQSLNLELSGAVQVSGMLIYYSEE